MSCLVLALTSLASLHCKRTVERANTPSLDVSTLSLDVAQAPPPRVAQPDVPSRSLDVPDVLRAAPQARDVSHDNTVQERLNEVMKQAHLPSLGMGVVYNGALQDFAFAGYADIEKQQVPTLETPYLVASVSKLVTVLSTLKALQQTHHTLDESMTDLVGFPVVNPRFPDHTISLRHVLTHTSSIEDTDIVDELTGQGDPTIALRPFLQGYLTTGGAYFSNAVYGSKKPGLHAEYSNSAIALAGLAVETITHTDFATYARDEILRPLQMNHSSYRVRDALAWKPAMTYAWKHKSFEPFGLEGWPSYPDGALRTSMHDLSQLELLLMQGFVPGFQALSKQEIFSLRQISFPDVDANQGLVLYRTTIGQLDVMGHNGTYDGAYCDVFFLPDEQVGVILLTNAEPDDDDAIESLELEWLERGRTALGRVH